MALNASDLTDLSELWGALQVTGLAGVAKGLKVV